MNNQAAFNKLIEMVAIARLLPLRGMILVVCVSSYTLFLIPFTATATGIIRDTTIVKNQPLRLEFKVPNINECGVKIHEGPKHASKSAVSIDRNTRIVVYEYQPKSDYTGTDSFVLVKGCFVNGDMSSIVADTLKYNITIRRHLSKERKGWWFW